MTLIVRFAPSPTGLIHIGNARTLLLNWLMRVAENGQFILRFDDTDVARSREEYKQAIREDLAWLGIVPDRVEQQSDRTEIYAQATQKLKDMGLLYPCYETQEELEFKRNRQIARHQPPVYDRASLSMSDEQKAGRTAHWRFKLSQQPVHFDDLIRGRQEFNTAHLSDPVLIREDGTWLYTLPSVVDDLDMGVTHVIRGEDHVTNTAVQVEIYKALGGPVPSFAHHSLVTGADGQGLSKRLGSLSLQSLREQGFEAMAISSMAALMGSPEGPEACRNMQALAERFDLQHLSRAPARFDEKQLEALNAKLLHDASWEEVAGSLAKMQITGGEAFWHAVRGNLSMLKDAKLWDNVVHHEIAGIKEDAAFLAEAAALLPPEPWNVDTWGEWTTGLKQATGRKGKALFMPLRLALTGLDHGPELAALLPLIGRAKALARLS